MIKYFISGLLLLATSLFGEVTVRISREEMKLNESVNVIFSSNEKIKSQPDFTPIEKDFDIITRNQSSSTRIINGKYDQEISWTLTLLSKHTGVVTLPSIEFDGVKSKQIEIKVEEASLPAKGDPIYLEVELTPAQEVYQQAELIYKIRLYRSVNLFHGVISAPKLSDQDAIIEQLGSDRKYEQMNDGTRYLVLERRYAIFPEHAGELKFDSISFEGQVVTRASSMFDVQTEYSKLTSEPLIINVKPIPSPFTKQNWLAATDVELSEEWSADPKNLQHGDAITRTITIAAKGCLASQIPDIQLNTPATIKQYPDKPLMTDSATESGNVGLKQIKIALIPSETGDFTLPEVKVKWWDVKTNQARETSLPATQLVVAEQPVKASLQTPPQEQIALKEDVKESASIPTWAALLIGLNGVWVALFIGLVIKRKKNSLGIKKVEGKELSISQVKHNIKSSCLQNHPKEAEKWLLEFSKLQFKESPPKNLSELSQKYSDDLRVVINELNSALYNKKNEEPWNGQTLLKLIIKISDPSFQIKKGEKENPLKELYS